MKLEDQVCSLELSKKLKELGVSIEESCFYWRKSSILWSERWGLLIDPEMRDCSDISAFTVAELGEMLPGEFEHGVFTYHLNTWWHDSLREDSNEWQVGYCLYGSEITFDGKVFTGTEADCRAKMFVYLIEQGIVKP